MSTKPPVAPKPTFRLTLGALADSPSKQIAEQGFALQNPKIHDMDADALSRLAVRCILTETEAKRARSRLMDSIAKDVRTKL